jgi:hypothetical protein
MIVNRVWIERFRLFLHSHHDHHLIYRRIKHQPNQEDGTKQEHISDDSFHFNCSVALLRFYRLALPKDQSHQETPTMDLRFTCSALLKGISFIPQSFVSVMAFSVEGVSAAGDKPVE